MTTEKFGTADWTEAAKAYHVLHHFKYGYSRLDYDQESNGLYDRLALILAQLPKNPDTKEALRKLLEVRDLHKRTQERIIGE
jgi:hypothetical protein